MEASGGRLLIGGAVIWLFLFPFSFRAFAASFDCARAATPNEKAICGDESLNRSDAHLAAEMRIAMIRVGDRRPALLAEQREWLRKRDAVCFIDSQIGTNAKANLIDCLQKAYDLRIDQLAASPSICERSVGRLQPLVEAVAKQRSDKTYDDWVDRLAKQPASGIALLSIKHFKYSTPEWLRQVKLLTMAKEVDPKLSDAVATSVSEGNQVGIGEVSPDEHLYVVEITQGRQSCPSDMYFKVTDGIAREQDEDVDDAGEDGGLCEKARRFGRIDGAPAVLDDEREVPSVNEEISIQLRTTGGWRPVCTLHLEFEPRLSPAREQSMDAASGRKCESLLCVQLEETASRLAKRAQFDPMHLEESGLAVLSPAQRKDYAILKQTEQLKASACDSEPDPLYAPVVVTSEVHVAKVFHAGKGCYGVVTSDWTVGFDRLRAGQLDRMSTYDVSVERGLLIDVKPGWQAMSK